MDKKNLWIIANWKSNKSLEQALDWVSKVGPKLEKKENIKIVVCPDFLSLEEVKKEVLTGGYPLLVGSQDLSPFGEGAYTGEEAAKFLREVVDLSILGHSERRQNFKETDEQIKEKVKQAKEYNIIPLVCVQGVKTPVPDGCKLVAYEPTFAIGTGNPDTPSNANGVASNLKQKVNGGLEVLYGGSVTSENIKAFLQQDNLSGALIGNASLDPDEFLKIVEASYGI